MTKQQTTSNILMIRPANFGYNEETAQNNAFQTKDESFSPQQIIEKARVEFDNFVAKLRERGIEVLVAEEAPLPIKPDTVFPNNWVTTHDDGTMILYPMFAKARRLERDENVIRLIESQFEVNTKIHLEHYEGVERYLEGTGSMIIDRMNGIVYACTSIRTDLGILDEFCDIMHYKRVAFKAVDGNGQEIYHTNVMMALGETFVVICLDTITDEAERLNLLKHFEITDKELLEISLDQMLHFAGNMLQVRNKMGETFLVMSEQAYYSLDPAQLNHIQRHTQIIFSDIKTIETYGGGSARCMMAEIFLKPQ